MSTASPPAAGNTGKHTYDGDQAAHTFGTSYKVDATAAAIQVPMAVGLWTLLFALSGAVRHKVAMADGQMDDDEALPETKPKPFGYRESDKPN